MEETEEVLDNVLNVEKLKYCFECGICTATCPVAELLPDGYNPMNLLQRIPLDWEGVMKDKGIWLCAWCYRCYKRCPQEIRVPDILLRMKDMAAEKGYYEGFKEALDVICKDIPLPLACLYACFNPGRGNIDKPETVEALKQLVADYSRLTKEEKEIIPEARKERIAIVGSGPAGLTAAQELAKRGYQVTVFESLSKAGGMMRWCIPAYRLPKEAVDAEIQRIRNLGVEIRTSCMVGKDLSIDDLQKEGYKAILIAIGAHKGRKLRIEGENLEGVVDALDFLRKASEGTKIELGDKVVVIGGGDVAMDAARIARIAVHLGAKDVTVIYRRSREEMPANPWEVKETEEENVKIEFLVTPKRILGKDGRVSALECVKMRLGRPDQTGRGRPIPVMGSEFTMEVDTVIPAIGESPDVFPLPKKVKVTRRNTIAVDPFDLQTGVPAIFAGGDVVRGPSTVIEAIIDGKRAADSIDRYLSNKANETEGD